MDWVRNFFRKITSNNRQTLAAELNSDSRKEHEWTNLEWKSLSNANFAVDPADAANIPESNASLGPFPNDKNIDY